MTVTLCNGPLMVLAAASRSASHESTRGSTMRTGPFTPHRFVPDRTPVICELQQIQIMKMRLIVILCSAALITSCARFDHQAAHSEPHAVLNIAPPPTESDLEHRIVKLVDGLPVSTGRSYRITPGSHSVVVRVVEKTSETYRPYGIGAGTQGAHAGHVPGTADVAISDTGRVTADPGHPVAGAHLVNVSVAGRRITYLTNSIAAQPGWSYECDGYEVRQRPAGPHN